MTKRSTLHGLRALPWMVAAAAVVSACGSGSEATTTVSKALAIPAIEFDAYGEPIYLDYPSAGTAARTAAVLSASGVRPLAKRCGVVVVRDINGELLLSAGSPTFVVLVEIFETDVDAAVGAGFVVADPKYMRRIDDLFECESKGM